VKITRLSLIAILAGGMVSVLNAEVNLKTSGQAVIYYQMVIALEMQTCLTTLQTQKANSGLPV